MIKIQTFHDFREKHNVSKTRTQFEPESYADFSQAILKMQILNETWTIIPHLSSEKQIEIMFDDATLLFHLFSKDQTNSAKPLALIWRGVFPLATSMLQYSAHSSPQDCKSCEILSPI